LLDSVDAVIQDAKEAMEAIETQLEHLPFLHKWFVDIICPSPVILDSSFFLSPGSTFFSTMLDLTMKAVHEKVERECHSIGISTNCLMNCLA